MMKEIKELAEDALDKDRRASDNTSTGATLFALGLMVVFFLCGYVLTEIARTENRLSAKIDKVELKVDNNYKDIRSLLEFKSIIGTSDDPLIPVLEKIEKSAQTNTADIRILQLKIQHLKDIGQK